jgi:hypothetical protein
MKTETDLTIEALQEKIAKVDIDMRELQSTGDASRKFEVLSEYKAYLEDELKVLKNEKRNSKT